MIKVLFLIPARGGSKGIERKNLRILAGKPLIEWTIEAAEQSDYCGDVVVSSDDNEILEVSRRFGAIGLERPSYLATDQSMTSSVVLHAISSLREKGKEYDLLVLLQPTSPLRNSKILNEAIAKYVSNSSYLNSMLISVSKKESEALKYFIENESGYIEGIRNDEYPFFPRQNLPNVYGANGAIYIFKPKDAELNSGLNISPKIMFLMDEAASIDIDSESDLLLAEAYINEQPK